MRAVMDRTAPKRFAHSNRPARTVAGPPRHRKAVAGGRGSRIRTCDLQYPKLPRYQAAPYPAGSRHWIAFSPAPSKRRGQSMRFAENRAADTVACLDTEAAGDAGIDFEDRADREYGRDEVIGHRLGIFGDAYDPPVA